MRFARSLAGVVLTVVVGSGWGPPQKTEKPSDLALKEKGLTKTATVYTIEDEKPVLARMKEARTAYSAFAAMASQHSMHEELAQQARQLEDQRTELQGQIDDVNQRIGEMSSSSSQGPGGGGPGGGGGGGGPGGMMGNRNSSPVSPLTIERDQLKSALAEVAAQQKTIKNQSPQAKDTKALEARVKQAEETIKAMLAELRTQVDDVLKKYTELGNDAAVKKALAEAKAGNPKLHLGPSDAFNSGVKELAKAEQHFLGKRTAVASKSAAKKKSRAKK